MKESLFQEHYQRFFCVPQQSKIISDKVSDAIFWNDQMAWSLGVIPWKSWRYPFQRHIVQYLLDKFPEQKENIYDKINTALATAHGDYFSLPTEQDREALMHTVKIFCSKEVADGILNQISSLREVAPFFNSFFLEKLLQRFSKNRKLKRHSNFVHYLSYFLHFRIIDNFFKRWMEISESGNDFEFNNELAVATFNILWNVPLQVPHFYTEKRLKADPSRMSPEIYNFWSWQYTYRNKDYQEARKPLEYFLFSSGIVFGNISISNHKEYLSVYKRCIEETNFFGTIFPEFDLAIQNSIEKFDYYPTWPIKDYTSDFILGRILSGDFQYWERETPPSKVSIEKDFSLCLKDPKLCTNEQRITQKVTDGKKYFEICAPECIIAIKEQEQAFYHKAISEDRSRIRPETIHRMIGLWLWDYCKEHSVKVAEAIEVLKKRHFSTNNPAWDSSKIPELVNNSENQDWYDYVTKTTLSATLYADYQDADRCIKAAKFLPRQRGLKKNESTKKLREKKRK